VTGPDLRAARKAANLTQDALAALCGWTQGRIADYETGRREMAPSSVAVVTAALDGTYGCKIHAFAATAVQGAIAAGIDPAALAVAIAAAVRRG
jgi:transcriptional regulator with XRE-family HTH domain